MHTGPPGDGGTGRGRPRWLVPVLAATVAVIVAAGVAAGAMWWARDTGRPVAVGEAPRPTNTTSPAAPAELRPPQGVYAYTGSGTDRLDRPPAEQAHGPDMAGTVTHRADGCWTFRIDYSTNHSQTWDYCPRDGGLVEVGGTTFQRWDFGFATNESTSTFTCDAPTVRAGQRPGDRWEQSCSGTSTGTEGTTVSRGTVTYVGPEDLDVGGVRVPTFHYLRERTNSGNQVGSERTDAWFAAANGLPVRNERRLEARTTTVIGDVTYTETGRFALRSPDPVP